MSVGWWLVAGYVVVFGLFSIAYWRSAFKTMALVDRYEQRMRSEQIRQKWRSRTLGRRKVRRG